MVQCLVVNHMPITIQMRQRFDSSFLADGDVAVRFCTQEVEPVLLRGDSVVFDFTDVDNMTDSFSNACFANLFKNHRDLVGNRIRFKACTPLIKDFVLSALSMSENESN